MPYSVSPVVRMIPPVQVGCRVIGGVAVAVKRQSPRRGRLPDPRLGDQAVNPQSPVVAVDWDVDNPIPLAIQAALQDPSIPQRPDSPIPRRSEERRVGQ